MPLFFLFSNEFIAVTIPIYLINLDRSLDRLAAMTAQLSKLGLQFERISAIDGRALQPNVIDALRETVAGWKPLALGEVGCFLSHRACWRRILDGAHDFGCILEDDIVLSPRLPRFTDGNQWIPADAEIVKLETSGVRIWLDRKSLSLGNGFSLQRLRSAHYRTGGYIVSRRTAERLLELTQRISVPVDLLLFDPAYGTAQSITTYQLSPSLCAQTTNFLPPDVCPHQDSTIGVDRGRFHRDGDIARRYRHFVQEGRKLLHKARRRRRLTVEFDAS